MAEKAAAIDVGQLRGENLPKGDFPAGGPKDFRVYIDKEIHEAVIAHAGESKSVEIGGVLVGAWQRDGDGPFVHVSRSIRCDAAVSRSGEVTFTHEAWNEINREMDTKYADLKIVGWYHSHPGFGIFLSERDSFIQQHFFSNPGQVAYVVDPVAKTEGVFVWRKGKTSLCPYYWVGDRVFTSSDSGPSPVHSAVPPGADTARPGPPEQETWPAALRSLMLYTLLFLVAYLLGQHLERTWTAHYVLPGLQRDAVHRYGLWKGVRPGLEEHLARIAANLGKIALVVDPLAKDHLAKLGDEAEEKKEEKKEKWQNILLALRQTRLELERLNEIYGLDPVERDELEKLIKAEEAKNEGLQLRPPKKAASAGESASKGAAAPADSTKAKPAEPPAKTPAPKASEVKTPPETKPAPATKPVPDPGTKQ